MFTSGSCCWQRSGPGTSPAAGATSTFMCPIRCVLATRALSSRVERARRKSELASGLPAGNVDDGAEAAALRAARLRREGVHERAVVLGARRVGVPDDHLAGLCEVVDRGLFRAAQVAPAEAVEDDRVVGAQVRRRDRAQRHRAEVVSVKLSCGNPGRLSVSEYFGAWKPGTSATFALGAASLAVAPAIVTLPARTAATASRQAASDAKTAFLTRRSSLPVSDVPESSVGQGFQQPPSAAVGGPGRRDRPLGGGQGDLGYPARLRPTFVTRNPRPPVTSLQLSAARKNIRVRVTMLVRLRERPCTQRL